MYIFKPPAPFAFNGSTPHNLGSAERTSLDGHCYKVPHGIAANLDALQRNLHGHPHPLERLVEGEGLRHVLDKEAVGFAALQ